MLTPKNIIIKCIFSQEGFIEIPRNSGNQWVSPPRIANTAPIEST